MNMKTGRNYLLWLTRMLMVLSLVTLAAPCATYAFAAVTPPTIMAVTPSDQAVGVAVTTPVTAMFSHDMDSASITTGSFTISRTIGIKAIAAGGSRTVALKGDGTVVDWGANTSGQSTVPAGLSGVTAVAAGYGHTVALMGDGTVVTWGDNTYGKTTVPAGLSGVTAIAAGGSHTVVLKDDGTVVAWGDNWYGQVTVPAGLTEVTAIAAGSGHTVALKDDGTVVAWGCNDSGQITVPAGLSGVIAIAAGGSHTVALKGDGTVVAWGDNSYYQTTVPTGLSGVTAIVTGTNHTVALKGDSTVVAWGDNSYGETMVPAGLSGVTAIAAGGDHTLALKWDGTMVLWGDNDSGQSTIPASLSGVTAIATGFGHTVALKGNGVVVAWGKNDYGQSTVPAGLSGVTAVAAGSGYTVALKGDGTVVAWGENSYGQMTVPVGLSGVIAIAAGGSHMVALKGDGTVVAWGGNDSGQTTVPAGLSGVTAIAVGSGHTVALKDDGTVVAWGCNDSGQITVPAGLSGVIAIAAGGSHTVALKGDGTVVVWGDNSSGQSTVPAGLSGVIAIAAGWSHTVALKSDGTVVAWGNNWYGETTVPAGLSGVTVIAAGGDHTLALKGDGTVAWDSDSFITSPLSIYDFVVPGTISYNPATRTATYTPSTPLTVGITYLVTVNTGVKALNGSHPAADTTWSFSAGIPVDGQCGSDSGATLTGPPVNLCAAGTPYNLTGIGPWAWTCRGSYSMSDAGCSAGIQTNVLTVTTSGVGTVTATPGPLTWSGATGAAVYNYGTSVTLIPNPTALSTSGVIFKGWAGACSGMGNPANNNACSITMTAATGVTATFGPAPITITTTAGSGGSITPTTIVDYGSTITVTVTPAIGYHIATVVVDGLSQTVAGPKNFSAGFDNVTANHTVSAGFAIDTFTVTFSSGGNGSLTGSTTQSVTYGGSSSPVTAAPDSGYHFVTWTGAGGVVTGSAASLMVGNVTNDITVTANFAQDIYYTLNLTIAGNGTINSTPSGFACGSGSCSTQYLSGTLLSLLATLSADSTITTWSGACSGSKECNLTMDGDKNVGATFAAAPKVKVNARAFATLSEAYNHPDTTNGSFIRMLDGIEVGPLTANKEIMVTLSGGENATYDAQPGNSIIQGSCLVQKGTVIMNRVTVR